MHRLDLFPLTGRAEAGAVIEAMVERHDERYRTDRAALARGPLDAAALDAPIGTRLRVRVRARDVMLAKSAPSDLSALNVLPGVVADFGAADGPIVEVRLDCNGEALLARLTRFSVERLGLAPGAQVFALVKSVALDRRSLQRPHRLQVQRGCRRRRPLKPRHSP